MVKYLWDIKMLENSEINVFFFIYHGFFTIVLHFFYTNLVLSYFLYDLISLRHYF
jgi:hypothetical protein